ncbi:MAG: hypothetical protein WC758_02470 [Candidatus Woesearchaeota archaeon]|jgi:hypothetical protein
MSNEQKKESKVSLEDQLNKTMSGQIVCLVRQMNSFDYVLLDDRKLKISCIWEYDQVGREYLNLSLINDFREDEFSATYKIFNQVKTYDGVDFLGFRFSETFKKVDDNKSKERIPFMARKIVNSDSVIAKYLKYQEETRIIEDFKLEEMIEGTDLCIDYSRYDIGQSTNPILKIAVDEAKKYVVDYLTNIRAHCMLTEDKK